MGFSIAGRYCNCWSCGPHPVVGTLQLLPNVPPDKAKELASTLGTAAVSRDLRTRGVLQTPDAARGVLPLAHRDYLIQRGFDTKELVDLWRISGIGMDGGHLKWRLFIPIHFHGRMVSWTTRTIGNSKPRYWAARADQSVIPIKNLLYGIDYVANVCIVVEGPTDVWAVGPGAVSLMGKRWSFAQLEQLSRVPVRYICLDAEPEAQMRAEKLAGDLSVFDGVTKIVRIETGKDAAECSTAEIGSLRGLLR
jgi:hypothetical protein